MNNEKKLYFTIEYKKEDDNNGKIVFENNEDEKSFKFNYKSDNLSDIDEFIEYLLTKIMDYSSLEFNLDETKFNNNVVALEIAKDLKKIWENDFKKIKDDIEKCSCDEN